MRGAVKVAVKLYWFTTNVLFMVAGLVLSSALLQNNCQPPLTTPAEVANAMVTVLPGLKFAPDVPVIERGTPFTVQTALGLGIKLHDVR
jgi:hypothetical protein